MMRSGIAKQIREEYPNVYAIYAKYVAYKRGDVKSLLSDVLYVNTNNDKGPRIIANIFSQADFGYDGKKYTDYNALRTGFINLRKRFPSASIGIPYKIGCGLGGEDWNIVEDIIKTVFRDKKSGSVTIYKLEE